MNNVVHILSAMPFIGRWQDSDGVSRVEFTVSLNGGALRVEGIDIGDGEQLEVKNIQFDGEMLLFESRTPSTGRMVKHRFRLRDKGSIIHEFLITDQEIWVRKS